MKWRMITFEFLADKKSYEVVHVMLYLLVYIFIEKRKLVARGIIEAMITTRTVVACD